MMKIQDVANAMHLYYEDETNDEMEDAIHYLFEVSYQALLDTTLQSVKQARAFKHFLNRMFGDKHDSALDDIISDIVDLSRSFEMLLIKENCDDCDDADAS
jgi:hypothetical protein